jgi:hypothetical protein
VPRFRGPFRMYVCVVKFQRCTHQPSWAGGAASYRTIGEHLTHARDLLRLSLSIGSQRMSRPIYAFRTALPAIAVSDGNVEPGRRSGGTLLDHRTWPEPVSTLTQHLSEVCPVRFRFKLFDQSHPSGASSVDDPGSAEAVVPQVRQWQVSGAGLSGQEWT